MSLFTTLHWLPCALRILSSWLLPSSWLNLLLLYPSTLVCFSSNAQSHHFSGPMHWLLAECSSLCLSVVGWLVSLMLYLKCPSTERFLLTNLKLAMQRAWAQTLICNAAQLLKHEALCCGDWNCLQTLSVLLQLILLIIINFHVVLKNIWFYWFLERKREE